MDGPLSLVALRCRTSERRSGGADDALTLAHALGERLEAEPRQIGSPAPAAATRYEEDLTGSRGCLLEAGGQVDDALAAGRRPVLVAHECSVAVTTLPAVAARRPDAWFLWLDAHGDFNTPATTPSGYLGGMCLAAACGRWDAGLAATAVDPARVILCGVRELDAGERVELERAGTAPVRPSRLGELVRDRPVFVHVDLDVLDPSVLPDVGFPAPGGFSDAGLRALLDEVARTAAEVIGFEVASFAGDAAELVADVLTPLAAIRHSGE
ncbi:MAG TPA: arginase family protein [Solirubrobacteraceae bacterium]|nr:arginase family protein [Solirubrobacteraceae bacterium]